jgi:hypothetical protein
MSLLLIGILFLGQLICHTFDQAREVVVTIWGENCLFSGVPSTWSEDGCINFITFLINIVNFVISYSFKDNSSDSGLASETHYTFFCDGEQRASFLVKAARFLRLSQSLQLLDYPYVDLLDLSVEFLVRANLGVDDRVRVSGESDY